jgi:hypothetical protein
MRALAGRALLNTLFCGWRTVIGAVLAKMARA